MRHRMILLGSGQKAVRLIIRTNGCELRFGTRVLKGNDDLANLLLAVTSHQGSKSISVLAASAGQEEEVVERTIRHTLTQLTDAGVPKQVWGPWWTSRIGQTAEE